MGMTIEQMLEILENYKLRIPPTVYYKLLADVQELEEEQEPTTKNDLAVDYIPRHKHDMTIKHLLDIIKQARKERDIAIQQLNELGYEFGEKIEPTKNDLGVDAVSRQAAIDAIRRIHPIDTDYDCTLYDKVDVMYVLNDLPSVTPQPRKGHWIGHRKHCENLGVMPSGLGAYEWCSNCDCGIDVREWHRNHYNFCPNCGCAMVEPQESEERQWE